MSRRLIVGLGNPGQKYEKTRHNIGFEALRCLGDRWGIEISRGKFHGLYGTGEVRGVPVALLEPQTFMNLSGKSVQAAAKFFDVPPEEIIVFHDEIDLEPGKLKLKQGGGHGGHNGLRDMVKHLSSKEFIRVRMGVGRPERGDVSGYVLSKFTPYEADLIDDLVQRACDAVETILREDLTAAQNAFH